MFYCSLVMATQDSDAVCTLTLRSGTHETSRSFLASQGGGSYASAYTFLQGLFPDWNGLALSSAALHVGNYTFSPFGRLRINWVV